MFCELTKCRTIILGPKIVIKLSYDNEYHKVEPHLH